MLFFFLSIFPRCLQAVPIVSFATQQGKTHLKPACLTPLTSSKKGLKLQGLKTTQFLSFSDSKKRSWVNTHGVNCDQMLSKIPRFLINGSGMPDIFHDFISGIISCHIPLLLSRLHTIHRRCRIPAGCKEDQMDRNGTNCEQGCFPFYHERCGT